MDDKADNLRLADPGRAEFQVGRYPFYLLNRLVSRYNGIMARRLRAVGLDVPTWRVLMILGERAPRGVRELADQAVIPLSTMTRIVQRMAAAALVAAAPSEEDARVTEVSLLPLGTAKLAAAREIAAPVYAQAVRGVPPREFDRLLALLAQLHANLDDL